MKPVVLLVSCSLPLLAIGCSVPKYQPTFASYRQAIVQGELKEALVSYEIQAQEAEKNAASSLFAQYYWGAAVVAYMQAASAAHSSGQLQKAVVYGEKALEIARRTQAPVYNRADPVLDYPPLPELSAIYTLLRIYRSVRAFDKASALIETGFTLTKEVRDINRREDGESILSATLGREFLRRQEYEKAIETLSTAVYLRKNFTAGVRRFSRTAENSENGLVTLIIELGDAYRSAGRLDEAVQQYQEAFEYVKEGRARYPAEYSLYAGIAQVNLQQKNFSKALENFQKALALAEGQRRTSAVSSVSRRIGDVLRRTGKPDEAVPYYQKAIQQIESTRSLLESEEYRQSFFEGQARPYASMIDALLLAGKSEEAFNYSERARSRVFLDVLGSKVQLSRAKSGLLERERALQERIAAIKARLSGEAEGETDRSVLRKQLAEAEEAYSAFLARVRKQDKEQISLMSVEPLGLREVQMLLDPGTSLLEYFVTDKEVFAWVVEREKLQFQRIELPKEKLSGLVKTLRESIFTLGERDKFNEAAGVLYKQLIEPLVPHIKGKELIIVPHDVLHYLPFHALVGPDGRYLIEKYPIYIGSGGSEGRLS
jgi:tetratricopeptide (TPR) repeat protein